MMKHLRHHSTLPLSFARALVLLVAVGAIIAGILAMHTLASSPAHAASVPAAMSHEAYSLSPLATATSPQLCDDSCELDHSMTMIGCILILLTGVLVAGIAIRRSGGQFTAPPAIVPHAASRKSSFHGLAPPDLNLLSISRV